MPSSILLFLTALASDTHIINMGDGAITGTDIAPYEYRWQQCSLVDGAWKNGSMLTEKVAVIGSQLLRIQQSSSPQPGVTSQVSHYVDRSTLAPIRSEVRFTGPDGKVLAERQWLFGDEGYQATSSQGGKVVEKSGALSNNMYNAIILGIPLATINSWDKPVTMTGMMTQFDASYTLTATQQGKETVTSAAGDVEARWIDVHWVHNEAGDVYPPGPEASGGRYWITEKTQSGLPRVLRYKTDSYVIEYQPQYCPEKENDD